MCKFSPVWNPTVVCKFYCIFRPLKINVLNTHLQQKRGRMRIILALLITAFLITAHSDTYAQEEWGGITLKRLFIDYQTLSANGDFGAFREYTPGLEFGYIYPFSNKFSVELPVKIGLANLKEEKNRRIFGADIHANYHFRDYDKRLRPYVLGGVGFVMENFDSTNVQIPLGFGLDFRVGPRAYLNWQSEVRLSTSANKDNFNHAIGFKYMFGHPEEPGTDGSATCGFRR